MSGTDGERTRRRGGRSWWTRWLAPSGTVMRSRGPRIVTIGGGTGLSVLLHGLKELTENITAVVTVADDGGSSGRLRDELGVPPMGDIRACIVALADNETQMGRLLQYRFPESSNGSYGGPERRTQSGAPEVSGHSFGNLLIAALTDITGDFEEAVRQANRVLAVRGRVVPVAGGPITLHAELRDGTVLSGESAIERSAGIERVWLTPSDIQPSREAVESLLSADLIVIGPGSLYTSLLAPLLLPGIRHALAAAVAPRVYVCNVATQVGETQDYALSDHLAAFERHGLADLIDGVLANDNYTARVPEHYPAAPVRIDIEQGHGSWPLIVPRDVVDHGNAHRHDSHRLAAVLLGLYYDRALQSRSRAAVGS